MPEPTNEPGITFSTFVISVASSGLMHLGPDGDDAPGASAAGAPDLALAAQTLDLLALLAEKTKGNLDEEESRLLEAVRHELGQKYERVRRRTGPAPRTS